MIAPATIASARIADGSASARGTSSGRRWRTTSRPTASTASATSTSEHRDVWPGRPGCTDGRRRGQDSELGSLADDRKTSHPQRHRRQRPREPGDLPTSTTAAGTSRPAGPEPVDAREGQQSGAGQPRLRRRSAPPGHSAQLLAASARPSTLSASRPPRGGGALSRCETSASTSTPSVWCLSRLVSMAWLAHPGCR